MGLRFGKARRRAGILLACVFLLTAILPTSAERDDAVNAGLTVGDSASPGEAGLAVEQPMIDMGEIPMVDLTGNDKRAVFNITNKTGTRLDNLQLYHRDPVSGEYILSEVQEQVFDGTHFYASVPEFIDPNGPQQTAAINVRPYTTGEKSVSPRAEPFEDSFRLEASASASGGETFSVDFSVTLTVTAAGSEIFLQKINGIQSPNSELGSLYLYLNNSLVDVNNLERSDFVIEAADEDGQAVELDENVPDSFEIIEKNNSAVIHFKAIDAGGKARVITFRAACSLAPDAWVYTTVDILPPTAGSNVPDDGKVRIKVVDSRQNPISGALVTLVSTFGTEVQGSTGNDGYADFPEILRPGVYGLVVQKDGYLDVHMKEPNMKTELTVIMSQSSNLEEGEKADVTIRLRDQYGNPVEDATVRFYCSANNGRGSRQTNANGEAYFELTANHYEIVASKSGYFTSDSRVLTVASKTETLDITLASRTMCRVTTTVLDTRDNPISGAKVYYKCPTDNDVGTAYTDASGQTEQPVSIRANDYILTVSKSGYDTLKEQVRVDEENQRFTVVLSRTKAVEDEGGSSNGSGSGSGSNNAQDGGGSSDQTVNANKQVAASEVNKQISKTFQEQAQAGKPASAEVVIRNAGSITPEALRSMRLTAEAANGSAQLLADTVGPNGEINARLYIDVNNSFYVDKEIKLGVSAEEKDVRRTQETFQKYFENEVSVVSFEHQGAFGMDVGVAVKVDLKNLDRDNLVFYSYDAAANQYTPIPMANAFIDANGYLHFTTSMGGDIIITDKPLTKK